MHRSAPGRNQRGAVILTACFFLLFLLGFMSFAMDLSRLFIVKTELQTAMDSCALAAAHELDGTPGALDRATSAGMTSGNLNRVNLQSASWDDKGKITADDISFFDAFLTPTTSPATARYVECLHEQPDVRLWLLQAMGAFFGDSASFPNMQDVTARAVATRGPAQTSCPVPLALRPRPGGDSSNFGYVTGEWITLLMGPGEGTGGYIGWANLDGSNNAAETERELLEGNCNVRLDQPLGTPGVQNSIADAWNARFGIYRNASGPSERYMQPDTTGYAYTNTNWSSGSGAYNGPTPSGSTTPNFITQQGEFVSYSGPGVGGGFNKIAQTADHSEFGSFNRRVVTVPVTNGYPGLVEDYACMLMLQPMRIPLQPVQLEYIGRAGAPGVPCTTTGLPGASAGPLVPVLVR